MVIFYLLYQTLTLLHFTDSNGFVRVGGGGRSGYRIFFLKKYESRLSPFEFISQCHFQYEYTKKAE